MGAGFLLLGKDGVQKIDDPAQALLVTLYLDFSGPEQITLDYRVSNNSLIDALHVAKQELSERRNVRD
jgi:hypothetical protein